MKRIRSILKPFYIGVKRNLLKARLRFAPVRDLSGFRRVLVIAPHPDDEILGAGGCIMNLLEKERAVFTAFLTDGEHSLPDLDPRRVAEERIGISKGVLGILGLAEESVFRFHFPDGKIPRDGDSEFAVMTDRLAEVMRKVGPDAVLVTHPHETWPYDHVAACEMAIAALDKAGQSDTALYGYWVWLSYSLPMKRFAEIDWGSTVRVAVGDAVRKKRLMDAYLEPLAPNGKPWSGVLPKEMLSMFDYPYEIVTLLDRKTVSGATQSRDSVLL